MDLFIHIRIFHLIVPSWATNKVFDSDSMVCSLTLQCMMHTEEFDFTEGCTPWSLTQRFDAQCRVWLCGGMNMAQFLKNSNILAKSKPNSKVLPPVEQGPRWVFESWKKTEIENLWDTLLFKKTDNREHTSLFNVYLFCVFKKTALMFIYSARLKRLLD